MKMNFIKGGLAALVLGVAALNSGCAISAGYKDSMEKVDCSFFTIAGATSSEVKHIMYKERGKDEVECEFDSVVAGSLLTGGSYEMKIYGNHKDLLWAYRIETDGEKDGVKQFKFRVKDSLGNQSDWESAIPLYLPSIVKVNMEGSSFSNLSGTTEYYNIQERIVNPKRLLSDEAKTFVREKVKAK
jgi:hypothetical protein